MSGRSGHVRKEKTKVKYTELSMARIYEQVKPEFNPRKAIIEKKDMHFRCHRQQWRISTGRLDWVANITNADQRVSHAQCLSGKIS
jgi:hypothetical protein